jgi:hypothetical protein
VFVYVTLFIATCRGVATVFNLILIGLLDAPVEVEVGKISGRVKRLSDFLIIESDPFAVLEDVDDIVPAHG